MILLHPDWEHRIKFEEGSFTQMLIENTATFTSYLTELYDQLLGEAGNFVLSEKDKEVNVTKDLILVTDPLFFDMNEKALNQKLTKMLTGTISSTDYTSEYNEAIAAIERLAIAICDDMPISVTYDELSPTALLKLISFHVENSFASPLEKLMEYINISSRLLNIMNYIIVNPYLYFETEQLQIFKKEMSQSKISLLFIDRLLPEAVSADIIIDSDNCEPKITN